MEEAQRRLAAAKRKEVILGRMLLAAQNVRRWSTYDLKYSLLLLRYYLIEKPIMTPEEFAGYEGATTKLRFTADYLEELEKKRCDAEARSLKRDIECKDRLSEPEKCLRLLEYYNARGHGKISEEEIAKLGPHIVRHKTRQMQEELYALQNNNSMWSDEKRRRITKLITTMDENGIPYGELGVDKDALFDLGSGK